MNYFDIPAIKLSLLPKSSIDQLVSFGSKISEPAAWIMKPKILPVKMEVLLGPIYDLIPIPYTFIAIVKTPALSFGEIHVDDIGRRITAINIDLQIDNNLSKFHYIDHNDPKHTITQTLDLATTKCLNVSILHQADNHKCPTDRLILSLSYTQTVDEMHTSLKASGLI